MLMSKPDGNRPVQSRPPRMPTFGFAKICDEQGNPLVDATVREISARGARLRLRSSARLPDRLVIRPEPDHSYRTATLKWQSGASIGVEFDREIETPKAPPDAERRIQVICSHLTGRSKR